MLNSDYFEEELEFIPSDRNTFRCIRILVSFQDDRIKLEANGMRYTEWVIGCKPDFYYAEFQGTYFLSRSYHSNTEVFAFRQGEDSNIVIENLFGNMRFKL